jgi:hypothetical protein
MFLPARATILAEMEGGRQQNFTFGAVILPP